MFAKGKIKVANSLKISVIKGDSWYTIGEEKVKNQRKSFRLTGENYVQERQFPSTCSQNNWRFWLRNWLKGLQKIKKIKFVDACWADTNYKKIFLKGKARNGEITF